MDGNNNKNNDNDNNNKTKKKKKDKKNGDHTLTTTAVDNLPLTKTGTSSTSRVESDSMGTIEVPAEHYWGAQTQRSLLHFSDPSLIVKRHLSYFESVNLIVS